MIITAGIVYDRAQDASKVLQLAPAANAMRASKIFCKKKNKNPELWKWFQHKALK